MEWVHRWQSRRAEVNRGKLKMRVDWGLFGFCIIIVLVILALAGVLTWAAIHCRAWRTIEQDTVVDKERRIVEDESCWYDSDGNQHCSSSYHEEYVLKFKNGDRWETDRATYERIRVGDFVTYPKNHFACDR